MLITSFLYVQVLSQRTCTSFRKTTSVGFSNFRGSTSVKVWSLLNVTRYCTYSSVEFFSSSKRRSRGPVMAAKKASEGDNVLIFYTDFLGIILLIFWRTDMQLHFLNFWCAWLFRAKAGRWKIQTHSWSSQDNIWHESKLVGQGAWNSENMGWQAGVQENCG